MKHILVVEDNKDNRYMIRYLLEDSGFKVSCVETGMDGVNFAIDNKPDLIIMDIQLPDINGLDATQRIRKSKTNGNIPIIALTSYAMPGDRQKALEAGCTGYIEKPIEPDSIIEEIKKFTS